MDFINKHSFTFTSSIIVVCRAVLPSTASLGGGWGSGL